MLFQSHRLPLADHVARRIALIKPSALGDIVHALPVLTALRRRFPAAHLAWVVNHTYEPLLRGHPDLDETIPFERRGRRGWWSGLRYYAGFLAGLRRRQFDLVIDLQGLLRSGLMTFATGAARRVGLASAREGASWFCTDIVPGPGRTEAHAVDRYWSVATALGAGEGPKVFRFPAFEAEQALAEEMLHGWPRPWLAVGVGARWQTKRWPREHFATLLGWAQAAFGGTAIFVGSPEDEPPARVVERKLAGPALVLAGRTTLPQLTALLARADVMVANDTGPLHLAAALGRPVIAPYTCTQVRLTGPYGVTAGGAIQTRVWCAGSLVKRCGRLECMGELTPERLWPLLGEVLRRWQSNNRSA
jgi:lipopolysaccharide heptosyltransferase I